MGGKTAVLVFTDGNPAEQLRNAPLLDTDAARTLIAKTNPDWDGTTASGGSLGDYLYPDEGIAYAGSFPGIDILCDRQAMVDRPSELPSHLLQAGAHRRRTILHTMHSVSDWFAFAIWENGELVRSLSLSPDGGITENIGTPLDFEQPYWAGDHPVTPGPSWRPDQPPYPLPFHPLELGGEAALRSLLGFIIEGGPQDTDLDADAVNLAGFRVPVSNPITQADIDEFRRTHTLKRYTFGPDGTMVPIED